MMEPEKNNSERSNLLTRISTWQYTDDDGDDENGSETIQEHLDKVLNDESIESYDYGSSLPSNIPSVDSSTLQLMLKNILSRCNSPVFPDEQITLIESERWIPRFMSSSGKWSHENLSKVDWQRFECTNGDPSAVLLSKVFFIFIVSVFKINKCEMYPPVSLLIPFPPIYAGSVPH